MKNKNGFTIIEIVFALSIFAAAMLVIWSAFAAVYGAFSTADNMSGAARALQSQLFGIQRGDYQEGRTTTEEHGGGSYYIVKDVRQIRPDLDEIRVGIFWKTGEKEKSAHALTYRSKPIRR